MRVRRDDQRGVPARQRGRHAVPPGEVRAGRAAARWPAFDRRSRPACRHADGPVSRPSTCAAGRPCGCSAATTRSETVYGDDPVAPRRGLRRSRGAGGSTSSTSTPPARASPSTGPRVADIAAAVAGRAPRADGRRRALGRRRTGARRGRRRPRGDGFGRGRAPDLVVVASPARPRRRGPRPPQRRARRPRLDRRQRPAPARRARTASRPPTRSSSPTSAATARWPDPTSTGLAEVERRDRRAGDRQSGGVGTLDDLRALAADARAGRGDRRQGALRGPLRRRRRSRRAGRGTGREGRPGHPLPRRHRRPRREGRQLRRPPRRRRPGRAGRPLRRRGRRRAGLPRHHRVLATGATRWSTSWPATAEQVFIPFTVGGGIRGVEDARRLLRAGRRQGQREHRGGRSARS